MVPRTTLECPHEGTSVVLKARSLMHVTRDLSLSEGGVPDRQQTPPVRSVAALGLGVQGWGFGVQDLGFGFQCLGFRVQGLRFGVQGFGVRV